MVTGSSNEEPNNRRLDQEIRSMVESITRHLSNLGKSTSGSGSTQQGTEGDHGVRIITLAGDNKGATMKAGPEEAVDTEGMLYSDELTMSAYTNSNYQSVNNSIMLGGSCHAEDPGVHVMITDYMDDDNDEDTKEKGKEKKEKKDKEKNDEDTKEKGKEKKAKKDKEKKKGEKEEPQIE